MNKVLDWIAEVREGCQKVIQTDLEEIMNEMKKGNTDTEFHLLLQEIRDNERDDALLSLIEKHIKETKK